MPLFSKSRKNVKFLSVNLQQEQERRYAFRDDIMDMAAVLSPRNKKVRRNFCVQKWGESSLTSTPDRGSSLIPTSGKGGLF